MNNFIQVQVTADISGLQNGLNQAQQAVTTAVNNMRNSLAGLGSAFASLSANFNNIGTQAITTSNQFNTLSNSIQQTTNITNNFNTTSHNTTQASGGAAVGVMGLTKAFLGLAAAKQAIDFIMDSNKALMTAESSFRGLEAVANSSGIGVAKAMEVVARVSKDGLVSTADASKSLQNLLSRGYSLEQAEKALMRIKDAAAFNRQSHLTMSQAVVTATEGLKNENSILVDNSGITKNVAKMWEEYAAAKGMTTEQMSTGNKIEAEMQGIMKETEAQLGNSQIAAQGMQGQAAKLTVAFNNLKETLGQALAPVMGFIIRMITDWMDKLNLIIRVIQIFIAHVWFAVTALGSFLKLLATRDFTKFKEEVADSAKELAKFSLELLKTKNAKIEELPNTKQAKPKDLDDNPLAKYNIAKVAFDKEMALLEAGQKEKEQSLKNELDKLKFQKDKGLLIHDAYVKKAQEIEGKLIDSQKGLIESRIEGLKKLSGLAVGNEKAKVDIEITEQEGKAKVLDTKKDGIQYKSFGGGGSGPTKQQIVDAQNKITQAQNEAELNLLIAGNKGKEAIYQNDFQNKKLSAEKYYSYLNDMDKQETQKRIDNLNQEMKALQNRKPKDKVEDANNKAQIVKYQNEIALAEETQRQNIAKNAIELENYNNKYKEKIKLNSMEVKASKGNADLDLIRIKAEEEYAFGRKSNIDMIELEKQLEISRKEIAIQTLNSKKELYTNDRNALADIEKEIEVLELEHAKRLAQINKDLTLEKSKDYIDMFNTVKQAGTNFLAEFAKHPKNFKENMMNALNTISDKLIQMASEKYMEKIMKSDGMSSFLDGLVNSGGGGGGIGSLLSSGASAISSFIPFLDTGTNYVPNDTLAMIHEGEAVIPKKYNNDEFLGGSKSGNVSVTNKFILTQAPDKRTQQQIAAMAGASIANASKRNS